MAGIGIPLLPVFEPELEYDSERDGEFTPELT